MEPVAEIKARLPIEDLVGQYCKLEKKGRQFVCLCPFHNDKHPSFLVSPDKGIAYCFACQKGGDVFSVYQLLEGVDFPQALRDLAEKTGVTLPDRPMAGPKADEKQRARDCLEDAARFFRQHLAASPDAMEYLRKRGITDAELETFEIGASPDSYTATYDHLLKAGFSRTEIASAGMVVRKDLEDRVYDRFRHRVMFPIRDLQGRLIAFGGRTLGNDDAKYINSSDGPLYRKSEVLFGIHAAKEAMRTTKQAVLVEGYFDVVACHRVGILQAVATCGTALTEEHARILKRYVETVVLCLDSDRAGRDAAERAFGLLTSQGLQVNAVVLPKKDPADLAVEDAALLKQLLGDAGVPYIEQVLEDIRHAGLQDPAEKRSALQRLLGLLGVIPSAVERNLYVQKAAEVLGTVESELLRDLRQAQTPQRRSPASSQPAASSGTLSCTKVELALVLFLFYPKFLDRLPELIPPDDAAAAALHTALIALGGPKDELTVEQLGLPPEHEQRVKILQLYWEEQGFAGWSDMHALRELKSHCQRANEETIKSGKLPQIAAKLKQAAQDGKVAEEEQLKTQTSQVMKLAKAVS